ncbi:CLUMA_CG009063, isoform A [Clunio marinus]|uniref:CLUMA_CG009063, isoform A n=1 Tax=Clunio marinus TaxID=568069 RepID=A0A1J1I7Q5_9DIPT|nr:CLUMA_CG009063, isoform A [Clunio marinus]
MVRVSYKKSQEEPHHVDCQINERRFKTITPDLDTRCKKEEQVSKEFMTVGETLEPRSLINVCL